MKYLRSHKFASLLMVFIPLLGSGCIRSSLQLAPATYYGKIIDQYGQPVSGVEVTGTMVTSASRNDWGDGSGEGDKTEQITTTSDADGLFSFMCFHPILISYAPGYSQDYPFNLKKLGYQMGTRSDSTVVIPQGIRDLCFQMPNKEDQTSSQQRAVFIMWKLQNTEPVYSLNLDVVVPVNGSPTHQDIVNRETVKENGDVIVAFTRTPQNADRKTPYSWMLKIEAIHGGLREVADAYPYLAPTDGYQKTVVINKSISDSPNINRRDWAELFFISYYYRDDGGKYARISIRVNPDYRPDLAQISFGTLINPSGSRNLEFDEKKLIPAYKSKEFDWNKPFALTTK